MSYSKIQCLNPQKLSRRPKSYRKSLKIKLTSHFDSSMLKIVPCLFLFTGSTIEKETAGIQNHDSKVEKGRIQEIIKVGIRFMEVQTKAKNLG